VCDTVLSLARQTPSVFLGRGADLILPADRGFRVRLVASLETRTAEHARQRHITLEEAGREIERIEGERGRYFHHHFGVSSNDPTRHDIVINLDRFDAAAAVELILKARPILRA
jgi:cytidylate kinase